MPATKTKSRSKLQAIADNMKSIVAGSDSRWVHQRLPQGLELILQIHDKNHWRLACARDGVYPSDVEIDIVRSAFDIDDAVEPERRTQQTYRAKTQRTVNYHVVEFTWLQT